MSDAPPTYYALTKSERDHLLAAAQLQSERGRVSGQGIQRQVEALRAGESRPGNHTTYTSLDTLREYGWMSKTDDGFTVTDDGRRVLANAKAEILQ